MAKIDMGEINLRNIKRYMDRKHSGKAYKVNEYKTFYSVIIMADGRIVEPILFNKKGAIPILKTFNQMPLEECKNPKLIYEMGGSKDGKK